MGLETLHKRFGIVINTTGCLTTKQATLSHYFFRAFEKEDKTKLIVIYIILYYIHLITDKLFPSFKVFHTARESINNNLLLTLFLIVLYNKKITKCRGYTDFLKKEVNCNLTRNNQTLLNIIINEFSIFASTIRMKEG